jgi:hypothetical protein
MKKTEPRVIKYAPPKKDKARLKAITIVHSVPFC